MTSPGPPEPLILGSAPGPVLQLLTLGATVQRLEITCGDGVRRNVVLARASPADYLAASDYLGTTIGRYANRIAGGRFVLEGRDVEVATSDRGNSLHGGPDGFDRREWAVVEQSGEHAVLEIVSPDGDQGFPGRLTARVRFGVSDEGVAITFEATTDATTVVNLTSHAYFNLDGAGAIDDHHLRVDAERYTPVDPTNIPLGQHAPVAETPFDFTVAKPIGATAIDHNFVIDGDGPTTAAVLESPRTRTRLRVETDRPGLQVYTGDFLDHPYQPRAGIALEPQLFPDSPNHPEWPSPVLQPGETYRAHLRWSFETLRTPGPPSA